MTGTLGAFLAIGGKATRKEWWAAAAASLAVYVALLVVLMVMTGALRFFPAVVSDHPTLRLLPDLGACVTLAAASIRRLRDRGRSPWLLAGWLIVSALTERVLRAEHSGTVAPASLVLLACGVIFNAFLIVELAFLPSRSNKATE